LLEHGAWVEGEREATDGRRQEWVCVRLIPGVTNLVLLSIVCGTDLNLDTHESVILHLALIVLGVHGNEEAVSIFLPLFFTFLRLHVALVVLLIDHKGTFGQRDVFKRLLEVKHAAANDVVALEEVSVIGLQVEAVVLAWELFLEQETVVEAGLASLATVMTICLLRIVRVEEGSDKDIRSAFIVHHLNLFGIPDD